MPEPGPSGRIEGFSPWKNEGQAKRSQHDEFTLSGTSSRRDLISSSGDENVQRPISSGSQGRNNAESLPQYDGKLEIFTLPTLFELESSSSARSSKIQEGLPRYSHSGTEAESPAPDGPEWLDLRQLTMIENLELSGVSRVIDQTRPPCYSLAGRRVDTAFGTKLKPSPMLYSQDTGLLLYGRVLPSRKETELMKKLAKPKYYNRTPMMPDNILVNKHPAASTGLPDPPAPQAPSTHQYQQQGYAMTADKPPLGRRSRSPSSGRPRSPPAKPQEEIHPGRLHGAAAAAAAATAAPKTQSRPLVPKLGANVAGRREDEPIPYAVASPSVVTLAVEPDHHLLTAMQSSVRPMSPNTNAPNVTHASLTGPNSGAAAAQLPSNCATAVAPKDYHLTHPLYRPRKKKYAVDVTEDTERKASAAYFKRERATMTAATAFTWGGRYTYSPPEMRPSARYITGPGIKAPLRL